MTYLFTHHDYLHLHAISGFLVIANFIYIFYNIVLYGSGNYNVLLCINHSILGLLALQFSLPTKRNFEKPMIWKEFRLHSILFTFRHVFLTILTLYNFDYYIIKHFVIIITLYCADIITNNYGDNNVRTTNSMPYCDHLDIDSINKIKISYTKKQFGATLFCILHSPDCNFLPLYGLQFAPFMMTLVRKGKIQTNTYHIIYSISLLLPFYLYFIFIRQLEFSISDMIFGIFYDMVFTLRCNYKINKYILWNIILPIFYYVYYYNGYNYSSNILGYIIIFRQIIIDYNIYKCLINT
jgi:hypothetical protein